jgi:type I restriction enzyme M protein
MSEEQRKQLQAQLWNIANTLRGKMGADEFRDYILGFIFYKYLSEKIERFANTQLKQEGIKYSDLKDDGKTGTQYINALEDAALDELGYFLKPDELFHAIAMKGSNQLDSEKAGDTHNFILGDLAKILKNIEQSTLGTDSEDDFENLFEDLDLDSSKLGKTSKEKNDLISRVLAHLDEIDFNLDDADADVLGDAYEYLIGEFASGAGKKAGEFYTPQPVSTLLARLVTANNKNLKSAYDPTCGSGSLLLRVKKEATQVGKIYGQELNRTTFNLARMNMILHDVHFSDFDIKQEDTLTNPQHLGLKFDAIVANPPFSAKWSASPLFMNDDRFGMYGKLAPKTKADLAFVQHIYSHLSDEGTAAVLLPHGALYRGASESKIRQYLFEELNCVDAVIGLPENIFYATGIPTCILVLKKCRKNPDDVLFIDASQYFEKVKNTNVLRAEDIDRIVSAYKERTDLPKFSHVASLADIKKNKWNLNIPRYVDTFDFGEPIDLQLTSTMIGGLEDKRLKIETKITDYCRELGLTSPFNSEAYKKVLTGDLRFKGADNKVFPKWKKYKLIDLGDAFNGLQGKTGKDFGVGKPFISYKQIFDSTKINIAKCPLVQVGPNENQNRVQYGDMFFTTSSETRHEVGFCSVLLNEVDEVYLNSFCFGYRLSSFDQLLPEFARFLFFSRAFRKEVILLAQGSTRYNISKNAFLEISIELPCIEEQNKIADFLTLLEDEVSLVTHQLELTKNYKQGLLQQMFI